MPFWPPVDPFSAVATETTATVRLGWLSNNGGATADPAYRAAIEVLRHQPPPSGRCLCHAAATSTVGTVWQLWHATALCWATILPSDTGLHVIPTILGSANESVIAEYEAVLAEPTSRACTLSSLSQLVVRCIGGAVGPHMKWGMRGKQHECQLAQSDRLPEEACCDGA